MHPQGLCHHGVSIATPGQRNRRQSSLALEPRACLSSPHCRWYMKLAVLLAAPYPPAQIPAARHAESHLQTWRPEGSVDYTRQSPGKVTGGITTGCEGFLPLNWRAYDQVGGYGLGRKVSQVRHPVS